MHPNLQTAYGTSAAESRNRVLRNTYALLGLSLIPTVIGALIGTSLSFSFMRTSPIMSLILMMVVMYGLMFAVEKNRYSQTGVYLLFCFTFVMGILLGPLLQLALRLSNGPSLIMLAGGATAAVFLVMASIATTTKRDLSGLGSFLTVGCVVLIVTMIANVFLQLPVLQLVLTAGFALLGAVLILFQVKQVVDGGETSYISAALSIFIGIYMVFSNLLQLLIAFGGGNSRD